MTNKARILAAAAQLFAAHGFRGTTTKRIAQKARVNEVTIFRAFGTKERLIAEAINSHASRDALSALPVTPVNPEKELAHWCGEHLAHLSRSRSLIRTCMGEHEERPYLRPNSEHGPEAARRQLAAYCQQLRRSKLISPGVNINAALAMLLGACFADAMGRDIFPALFPQPADNAAREYTRLFLRSLGFDAAAAKKLAASKALRTTQSPPPKQMTRNKLMAAGAIVLAALLQIVVTSSAAAQAITLAEALRRAEAQSEAVGIARTGVARTNGEQVVARSSYLPQVSASLGYTKTLKSQFESFASSGGSNEPDPGPPPPAGPCNQYLRDAGATIEERVSGVELATRCSLGSSLFDGFGDLPFGQENQWNLGLSLSQNIFSGGRVSAAYDIARSSRRAADIELASQLAQLRVSVTEAYYDAVLADRLVEIADSSLSQTEAALKQTELLRQVGDRSEFELLRARVTRDNQRPMVIQRRAERDIAYFRLKQLIGHPYEAPLQLATLIQDQNLTVGALPAGADTASGSRATVRQAAEAVSVNEGLFRIQRAERLPGVSLSSQYGRVGYPSSLLPRWGDFLDNWTVGVSLQLPVFTGGRLRGSEMVARANTDEAKLRLQQATELAALDARATIASLREAEETWRASLGTVEQAQRAYDIAEVRFREGLSTQLELTESRVLLQSAQANRAVAARNLQVIQVRLTVLADLPLGAGGGGAPQGGGGNAASAALQQLQQQQQQRMQQNSQTTMPGGGAAGAGPGGIGGFNQ